MKRLLLLLMLAAVFLSGCAAPPADITPEEIIAAYEDAGYIVASGTYEEVLDHGVTGYIRADHPDGDYIYFSIFESEADAQAYEDANHPGILWFFSVLFGDPSWRYCEAYGKIAVEYTDPKLFETFKDLMEGK